MILYNAYIYIGFMNYKKNFTNCGVYFFDFFEAVG